MSFEKIKIEIDHWQVWRLLTKLWNTFIKRVHIFSIQNKYFEDFYELPIDGWSSTIGKTNLGTGTGTKMLFETGGLTQAFKALDRDDSGSLNSTEFEILIHFSNRIDIWYS